MPALKDLEGKRITIQTQTSEALTGVVKAVKLSESDTTGIIFYKDYQSLPDHQCPALFLTPRNTIGRGNTVSLKITKPVGDDISFESPQPSEAETLQMMAESEKAYEDLKNEPSHKHRHPPTL